LHIEVGESFNLNSVLSSIESLYGTNLFEWVYADVEPHNGGVRLFIHVKEKKWVVARFGLRFDETNHTKGQISLSRENILGLGNQFSAILAASERNKLFLVESRNARIYKSLYTYSIKAYRNYRLRFLYHTHSESEDYGDDRYGAIFSIGQHMDRLGNAMFQLKTETLWITTGPKEHLEKTKSELRSIVIRSLIDGYDRYPFPNSGILNLMYVETTSEILGGTERFVKLYWGGSIYHTLARKHTISGSFSLGTADPSLPDIEAFTLGGTPSRLNCYDWESSGSHFYADFPGLSDEEHSGHRLASCKATYRLFVPKYFYLDLTYSIGNVWKQGQSINARSLLQSYGIRGSFATVGGPVSFGWGITSKGDDRIYMSAGYEF
jgi:outer membrane protein assembly factor BamA